MSVPLNFPFLFQSFSVTLCFLPHLKPSPPLQALLLPGNKSPSFQPYGSIPQDLARVGHPSLALPLLIMLPSQSLFVCHPLSKIPSFFDYMDLLITVSLALSLYLPHPLSVPLLLSLCFQVTLHASFPSLSSPLPHAFSLGAQPTYRNRSWPAVSQICSFTVFPPTLTTRDPNSTPIVWLESCLTGSGRERRDRGHSEDSPSSEACANPFSLLG